MKGQYQELWNIYTFLILLHIFQNSSPVTTAFSSQDELQMNWTQGKTFRCQLLRLRTGCCFSIHDLFV